jgi:hypothetical protein
LALWLFNALNGAWQDPDVQRCGAAVFALLVAADICASAVVRDGRDPASWAESVLARGLAEGDLDRLVGEALKGQPLRPFQARDVRVREPALAPLSEEEDAAGGRS